MISTKGRYALRVMVDLAEHHSGDYIPMKDIVERQDLSQKYLERIMALLSKHGYVDAVHGKGGGYRLTKHPKEYVVRDILELTEGTLAPVACLECDTDVCNRADECRTLPLWRKFYELTTEFFGRVTIEDLMFDSNYVI